MADLETPVTITKFDKTKSYTVGSYIIFNDSVYKCILYKPSGIAFSTDYFEDAFVKNISSMTVYDVDATASECAISYIRINGQLRPIQDPTIINTFDSTAVYNSGDVVRYKSKVYRYVTYHAAGEFNDEEVELTSFSALFAESKNYNTSITNKPKINNIELNSNNKADYYKLNIDIIDSFTDYTYIQIANDLLYKRDVFYKFKKTSNNIETGEYILYKLNNIEIDSSCVVATEFDQSINYNIYDRVIYNEKYYMFNTNHTAGNWTESQVVEVNNGNCEKFVFSSLEASGSSDPISYKTITIYKSSIEQDDTIKLVKYINGSLSNGLIGWDSVNNKIINNTNYTSISDTSSINGQVINKNNYVQSDYVEFSSNDDYSVGDKVYEEDSSGNKTYYHFVSFHSSGAMNKNEVYHDFFASDYNIKGNIFFTFNDVSYNEINYYINKGSIIHLIGNTGLIYKFDNMVKTSGSNYYTYTFKNTTIDSSNSNHLTIKKILVDYGDTPSSRVEIVESEMYSTKIESADSSLTVSNSIVVGTTNPEQLSAAQYAGKLYFWVPST